MRPMRVEHIGVAVADIDAALKSYEELFGYRLLRGPFDEPSQKATVAFIGTGEPDDVIFELITPLGEDSHVAHHLARGVSAYHVCYEVDDIEATLASFKARGSLVVCEPVSVGSYDGRRIAWVMTPTHQLTEFVERAPVSSSASSESLPR